LGNILSQPYFQKFLLSFDNQDEDFSTDEAIKMCMVDIDDFVKRHPENLQISKVIYWNIKMLRISAYAVAFQLVIL